MHNTATLAIVLSECYSYNLTLFNAPLCYTYSAKWRAETIGGRHFSPWR